MRSLGPVAKLNPLTARTFSAQFFGVANLLGHLPSEIPIKKNKRNFIFGKFLNEIIRDDYLVQNRFL